MFGRFRALFNLDKVPIEHFWKFLGLSMLSGASSGAVCLAVLYPLDFARTRVGTDIRSAGNRQFRGSVDCLRQAYSTVVSCSCGRVWAEAAREEERVCTCAPKTWNLHLLCPQRFVVIYFPTDAGPGAQLICLHQVLHIPYTDGFSLFRLTAIATKHPLEL